MRGTQVYLMAATRFLCYLTRGQVGVILPYLTAELQLSPQDSGQLLSQYASGYLLTQILGGLCADQYGAAPVVAVAIAMSSLLCFVAAGTGDVGVLGSVMFVTGLAQGVIMPAGNVLVAQWCEAEPIDSGSPRPVSCAAALTWARLLDHAGCCRQSGAGPRGSAGSGRAPAGWR